MPQIEEEKQRVIEEITRAFDGVSRDSGLSLNAALALDEHAHEEEHDDDHLDTPAVETDTRWQDVPESDIDQGSPALGFFDPIGFRYYLPAFMIWSLQNYGATDSASVITLLSYLQLSPTHPEHSLARFELLNPAQSAAVCAFLRFLEAHGKWYAKDAKKALKDHWAQFCEE